MRFPVLILALLLAAPLVITAAEARAETVADIEAAWRGWMTKSGRTTGGLAVMHQGRLAHQAVMGVEAAGNAVPLASLSKAVTGVCIAGLVDRGRLGFDTPLSPALARTFARLGAPADPRMQGVTIGQLLVHRAGFDRAGSNQVEGGDPVTGQLFTYLRTATATRPSFDEQMKWVLRRRLPLAPGERFAYTNATYLMLGAVIEEASGQDYESYCRNTMLAALGVRGAALDPAWRIPDYKTQIRRGQQLPVEIWFGLNIKQLIVVLHNNRYTDNMMPVHRIVTAWRLFHSRVGRSDVWSMPATPVASQVTSSSASEIS